jgi:uncharacterized repeat protein (TIGR03803 family)
VLYAFTGGFDGNLPFGALGGDANGNLYGVAQSGGDLTCAEFPGAGCGTVFKLTKNGLVVLHTFHGGADGSTPSPGLLIDGAGNVYGTASAGGAFNNGNLFKISPDGTYTSLHDFTQPEGKTPNGGLVSDSAGNFYGTAQAGGSQNFGTVFQLSPNGQLKVLHSFAGDLDGAFPLAGVIRDRAGHLYGTTVRNFLGQQIQGGSAFRITP